MFALFSVVSCLLATVPLLSLVSSVQYAQDFESGTHTAGYGSLDTATWFAAASALSAGMASVIGTGKARTVGTVVLMVTGLFLLARLPG